MNSQASPGTYIPVHPHSLFGTDMLIVHEPAWFIGSDRDRSQIERAVLPSDILTGIRETQVSGKKETRV